MKGQKLVKTILVVFVVSFLCCVGAHAYYDGILDSNQVLSNMNRTQDFLESAQEYNSNNPELYSSVVTQVQKDLDGICEISSDKSCKAFFILNNEGNTSKQNAILLQEKVMDNKYQIAGVSNEAKHMNNSFYGAIVSLSLAFITLLFKKEIQPKSSQPNTNQIEGQPS